MLTVTTCEDCRASTAGSCPQHPKTIHVTGPLVPAVDYAPERRPYACPVCFGTGHVAAGFYTRVGVQYWPTTGLTPEPCRSCDATGIVWG